MSELVTRILRLLPDGVLRRLLPTRLGFDGADAHPLTWPQTPVRLLIAPTNFAGQGEAWARAAERLPGVGAVSETIGGAGPFRFLTDQRVPASVALLSRRWRTTQRRQILDGATHVIVESGRSPFGPTPTGVRADIERMRAAGIAVAHLSHGTDTRSPQRHARTHPQSPYRAGGPIDVGPLEAAAAAHRALMGETGLPVFVSTPGLLEDVPDASWLPVVIDRERWATDRAPLHDAVPVVVHAPSDPAVKGSDVIEPVLERLVDAGLIRYVRLRGIPAEDMPAALSEADIVLDQFRLGDYGVAACEAMAAGRVVVSAVDASVRAHVEAETGLAVPIVQAEPDTLEAVLRGLLEDRDAARAQAALGPRFVSAVHDGRRSAEVLRPFLRV